MKLIIATDIFGKTGVLEEISEGLSPDAAGVAVVDPYEGQRLGFTDEDAAYAYFQKNTGMRSYQNKVLEAVTHTKRPMLLVGFSVGASAIWSISENAGLHGDINAIGFYGSQIRHRLDIDPKIPMDLYFPQSEAHFDVPGLVTQLAPKSLVTSSKVPYRHGFMNRKSRNFDAAGFGLFFELLRRRVKRDDPEGGYRRHPVNPS